MLDGDSLRLRIFLFLVMSMMRWNFALTHRNKIELLCIRRIEEIFVWRNDFRNKVHNFWRCDIDINHTLTLLDKDTTTEFCPKKLAQLHWIDTRCVILSADFSSCGDHHIEIRTCWRIIYLRLQLAQEAFGLAARQRHPQGHLQEERRLD